MAAVKEFEFDVTSEKYPETTDPQASIDFVPDQWVFTNLGSANVKVSFGPHLGDNLTLYGAAPGNQPPSLFTRIQRLYFRLEKSGGAVKVRALGLCRK